ncbi:MAG: heparin lyase I family protein [Myxococcota bacterium]
MTPLTPKYPSALLLMAALVPVACSMDAETTPPAPTSVLEEYAEEQAQLVALKSVTVEDSTVTLRFTNHGQKVPEGGYEIAYGPTEADIQRTREDFSRLHSDDMHLEMTFELENAANMWFAVFVRDNEGYYYTNALQAGADDPPGPPPPPPPPPPVDDELPEKVTWLRTYEFGNETSVQDGSLYGDHFDVWGDRPVELVSDPLADDGQAVRMRIDRDDTLGHEGDNGASRAEITLKAPAIDNDDLRDLFATNMGNAYARYGATVVYQVRTRIGENYSFDPASSANGLEDECNSLWEFKMDRYSGTHGKHLQDALIRNRMEARQHNIIFKSDGTPPELLSNGSWKYSKSNHGVMSTIEDAEVSAYTNWTIVAKWHLTEGFMRVYKDKELVYDRTDTYTVYNAQSDDDGSRWGPYFKFGAYDACYKAGYPANKVGDFREVYFDRFRIGVLD